MANVRLENLTAIFGTHQVFEEFSLTIRDGECFTLLGPSGCGKTVVGRMIAGFEHPSAGEIYIGDQLVSSASKDVHIPTELRGIGVVFQDYAVWPHKTVYQNISYPLEIQQVAEAELTARCREAIALVHLEGLADRYPSQLSGGQQQRVALARALVSRPKLLLLDEPLTNLDANLREEMRFEIKDLQKQTGVTILYVTHDQEIALAISDRMGIMGKDGALRQIGTPHEIYTNPDDGFVFNFLGVANFIPVEHRNGVIHIQGSEEPLHVEISPDTRERIARDEVVGACRPFEIDLVREGGATRGVVRRRVFLGSIVIYFIMVGEIEIRAQQEAAEAFLNGRALEEGESCGIDFHALRWYEKNSIIKEA